MKTDLDCVIEAVEITLGAVKEFTDVDDMLLTLSNNLRYMKQQQEMEKVADTDYHYWDLICPLGHNIRCTTESQKNEWQESEAMVTKCKECAKYYSWTQCTFKPHQEEQQKCEHGNMVNLHDEKTGLFKDTFECQTCGYLQKSNNLPVTYHSGKDALDKLMRGECDYIVFDDVKWKCHDRAIRLNTIGSPFNEYAGLGDALHKSYYLGTKWLCLKDDK